VKPAAPHALRGAMSASHAAAPPVSMRSAREDLVTVEDGDESGTASARVVSPALRDPSLAQGAATASHAAASAAAGVSICEVIDEEGSGASSACVVAADLPAPLAPKTGAKSSKAAVTSEQTVKGAVAGRQEPTTATKRTLEGRGGSSSSSNMDGVTLAASRQKIADLNSSDNGSCSKPTGAWLFKQSQVFLDRGVGARPAAAAKTPPTQALAPTASPLKKRRHTPPQEPLSSSFPGPSAEKADAEAERVHSPLCVCCQQPPVRPKVSVLCGHLACSSCWSQWLANKFDCPVCRRKVRPNNVIRILGWSDG